MLEEIGRALVRVTVDDRVGGADEHRRTIQRYRSAEKVVRGWVACDEGMNLAPGASCFGKDVSFARAGVAANRRDICSDERVIVIQCDGVTKVSVRLTIVRRKLLRLG